MPKDYILIKTTWKKHNKNIHYNYMYELRLTTGGGDVLATIGRIYPSLSRCGKYPYSICLLTSRPIGVAGRYAKLGEAKLRVIQALWGANYKETKPRA